MRWKVPSSSFDAGESAAFAQGQLEGQFDIRLPRNIKGKIKAGVSLGDDDLKLLLRSAVSKS
jgi:hypothetical protein